MAHPKDRSGMTRGQLLRGAAGAAVLAAGGGVLAGCENTTTAVGVVRVGRRHELRSSSSPSRSARSACRCRAPTTPSPGRCSTTTSRSGRASPARAARCGSTTTPTTSTPARVKRFEKQFNCNVQIATYNSADEAYAKLAAGSVALRRRARALGASQIVLLQAQAADAAAEPRLPAEPREEHLAGAAEPVLRPRRALHGAVRRLVGRHRLAQRQDQARTSPKHEGAVGHLLGVAAA